MTEALYQPPLPPAGVIEAAAATERGTHGLYFRTSSAVIELAASAEACTDLAGLTTDELCAWVDLGWKAPHGSYAATERFRTKAAEESGELTEALDAYVASPTPENHRAAASELVDTLWPAIAASNNAACNLDAALRRRLGQYWLGLRYIGPDGIPAVPPWSSVIAAAISKPGALNLGNIQAVIDAGFVPQPSPNMVIEHDEVQPELPEDYASLLAMQSHVLHMFTVRQREYGNQDVRVEVDTFVQEGQEIVGPAAAEMVLLVAALGRHVLGISLADLTRIMIDKIGGRIAQGRVDKSDGERNAL